MNENSNFSGSNDNTSKAEQKRAIEKAERQEVRKEQQDTDVFDDGLDEKDGYAVGMRMIVRPRIMHRGR